MWGQAQCPTFSVSSGLAESEGCCANYYITLGGVDAEDLFGINVDIDVSEGYVKSTGWLLPGNPYDLQGIQPTVNNSGINMGGFTILSEPTSFSGQLVLMEVCGDPGACVNVAPDPSGQLFVDGQFCPITVVGPPAEEYCVETQTLGGLVETPGANYSSCPDGTGIENAQISITNTASGVVLCEPTTNEDGQYSCETCDIGPYTVCVDTECPEPCGVTLFDLEIIINCILGLADCDERVWFAGDVNGSGSVSGADAVALREMLLVGENSQEIKNWCRFIPSEEWDLLLRGTYDPTLPDPDNCIDVDNPSPIIDFVQLNLGDVNGSCNDCNHGEDDSDMLEGLSVAATTTWNGRTFTMDIGKSDIVFYAVELALPEGAEIAQIETFSDSYSYRIEEGVLSIMWNEASLTPAEGENSTLLSITFDAEYDVAPSIITDVSKSVFYTSTARYVLADMVESRHGEEIEKTLIVNNSVELPLPKESGYVALHVLSLDGQIVSEHTVTLDEQETYFSFDTSTLTPGLYLISAAAQGQRITKKMIVTQ